MEMYHFVTKWFFKAPIERVWEEIIDWESYPNWWQSVKNARIRGSEHNLQLGSVIDCEVRGSRLYTLRFWAEVTALQPPNLQEIKSSGDLMGGGKWLLESQDGDTATTFYWDVGTTNPIMNLAGKLPFVKTWMQNNHDKVMANGYKVLKAKLER
jgi:uncharacterized protein YndB with AHSA1/START domain